MTIDLRDMTADELVEFYAMVCDWCETRSNTFVTTRMDLEREYPSFCNKKNKYIYNL